MKKSVNLYFNSIVNSKEKFDAIKEVGYDEFYTGIDLRPETYSLRKQMKYAKKLNLKCTMIHCEYDGKILDNFWLDNKIGDYIVRYYSKQMRKAKGYTDNFVVHFNGSRNSIVSELGLERIRKLLKVAEKCNLNMCIENLFSKEEIPYIFKNIKHDRLKICFDVGHRNFLTPDFDVLGEYGEFVSVLHVHDNQGKKDDHTIIGEGTIDLDEFAMKLAKCDNIVLSSEVRQKDDRVIADYLKANINALNYIDNKVNQYKEDK